MTERWLLSAEAAALLRISEGHLRRLRSRGGGPPFYKIGGRVLYAAADIDAWPLAGCVRGDAAPEHGAQA